MALSFNAKKKKKVSILAQEAPEWKYSKTTKQGWLTERASPRVLWGGEARGQGLGTNIEHPVEENVGFWAIVSENNLIWVVLAITKPALLC